jgi:outer membrane protein OmpA-like peptidoglycan-associated protein
MAMLALFAFLLLGLAGSVEAQQSTGSLVIPDEFGLPGVFETHSSQRLKAGALVIGTSDRFHDGLSMLKEGSFFQAPDSSRIAAQDAIVNATRIFLVGGFGFDLDGSLFLPVYYEFLSGVESPPDNWGMGDVSAILKYRLPLEIPFVSLSIFGTGSAPTSSHFGPRLPKQLAFQPASGRLPDKISHSLGMDAPRAGLGFGISFDFSDAMEGPQVLLHANASFDRTLAPNADNPLGVMAASLAAEAYLMDNLRLEVELRHQRLAADPSTLGSPLARSSTIGLGLGWLGTGGLSLRAGGLFSPADWNPYLPLEVRTEAGLTRKAEYRFQPTLSVFAQVSWQGFPLGRDVDHDGVPDGRDICPTVAEDRDGFQDDDGCPDPDNDGDGVLDGTDGCPYTPEDHDGFEDRDGCPEMDNDHDGFLDSLDHCPNDPEDRDGYQDDDGCPDLDDDKDGIPDALDKCPREAENRNGVEDEDGCPELDTDGDGIPDSRDKCPREDEIVNFYQDDDGCPDEKPEPIRDAVLKGVEFQGNGAELLPSSYLVLDGLAARLFAYPGTNIEIQGYLDDRSGPGAKALSQARAQAVAEYLVNRGIESRRIKAVGYGSSRPVAPNRTAQGRASNRRIQIHRLN